MAKFGKWCFPISRFRRKIPNGNFLDIKYLKDFRD